MSAVYTHGKKYNRLFRPFRYNLWIFVENITFIKLAVIKYRVILRTSNVSAGFVAFLLTGLYDFLGSILTGQ